MTDRDRAIGGPEEWTTPPADGESDASTGDSTPRSAALVGVAGGVGTTRLTVEVGAVLARSGHRVAAFDAALGTQGMVDYVEGAVDPDVTDLVTDEGITPAAAMVELPTDAGEFHLCPARAPFGDLARAKSPDAARRLEAAIAEAREAFDFVLVDTPPLASNPSVAAVTTADSVGVVTPPTPRGADALQRLRGRLADVGSEADLVVANRGGTDAVSADVSVPEGPSGVGEAPTSADGDGEFSAAVAHLAEETFEVELDLSFETGGLIDRVR